MTKVAYGNKTIDYFFEENNQLKSHYISVEKHIGVVLKGCFITEKEQQKLILKKASWILEKLALVCAIDVDAIVTGSRMQYLGRKYYVQLLIDDEIKNIEIDFTASKFKISLPNSLNNQADLKNAFEVFFRRKAIEKITPRINKWAKKTGLSFKELKIRKLEKRWGSCTASNTIIINIDAIKLPFSLIDYLIVHELAHTKVKNHSKEFWAEVAKYMPNWKKLDAKMDEMKL
ncbi:M48 family metallopeptidase [Tenacibaculum finnmarkense]|uniref:Metal-dependent hydrolase n=1 Tax=Tenacibaculum finnmarkense genomovar ulcerans TaxID=2781388 RepID=A0A2I2M891_9FLAO|nr:SprT family zinc-dependent metalloprotease [Tenacibaculum finnmarkense]ALU75568.1 metal-dependent hydrolase [Tenacibaculum dicentrarchi]MBE7632979.1 DUF45 domain-containing protein [Tenacibaculum finnmarkense genomovar ulcerans]MBE7648744.1 DUF45 domain-containing protein [Tenacibaculum finnmarkense genomovar ulcerans]MBE7697061.1 DUF45 domain-containing protein [Tenacibaculum finnmarkense genomovar ulcerans]MCD8422017.1 M48 family metallopeptidase [Tenacibaculum finnmarkense genomovar ulce